MGSTAYEIAVIGGGIVGMATAMALIERGQRSLLVLEKEERLAAHQTGNNSGVIHSGLYYKPGSLKARNCVEGREALYHFCAAHDIAHERCGKVVIATNENEIPTLDEMERRGIANGLQGIRRLNAGELRNHEPHAAGIAALHVPETGIVDFVQVVEVMSRHVQEKGGEIRLHSRAVSCQQRGKDLTLETSTGNVTCHHLINCAGLQCDRIARLCGVDPELQIVPFRGEYYELISERQSLVRNLIYPVPDPRFPFLGVHFTRMIHGGVEAGPNAVLAFKREGYSRASFSLRDTMQFLGYSGFWRMAAKYWTTSLGEFHRSLSKRAFVTALQKLLPELQAEDLRSGADSTAGVRAQAVLPDGSLADDFRIIGADNMIHVLNAPSPAATASISIGRTIADMAVRNFGFQE